MKNSLHEQVRAIRLTAFQASIAERRIICLSQADFEELFPIVFVAVASTPELKLARDTADQAQEFASSHNYRYRFDEDTLEHYFYPLQSG